MLNSINWCTLHVRSESEIGPLGLLVGHWIASLSPDMVMFSCGLHFSALLTPVFLKEYHVSIRRMLLYYGYEYSQMGTKRLFPKQLDGVQEQNLNHLVMTRYFCDVAPYRSDVRMHSTALVTQREVGPDWWKLLYHDHQGSIFDPPLGPSPVNIQMSGLFKRRNIFCSCFL